MGYIEVFEMNDKGAGWSALENTSVSTKIDIEWALMNKPVIRNLCFVCHTEIGRGNVCANHKNVRGAFYLE
jgi:hypothetical protein